MNLCKPHWIPNQAEQNLPTDNIPSPPQLFSCSGPHRSTHLMEHLSFSNVTMGECMTVWSPTPLRHGCPTNEACENPAPLRHGCPTDEAYSLAWSSRPVAGTTLYLATSASSNQIYSSMRGGRFLPLIAQAWHLVYFHTDFLTECTKPNKIACIRGLCVQISTQIPSAALIPLHGCSACDHRAEPKGLTGWSRSNKWHSCSDNVPGCPSVPFWHTKQLFLFLLYLTVAL